jgi:hypothetical protein
MEDCPPGASFEKIKLYEKEPVNGNGNAHFYEAHPNRVMLIVDDNFAPEHWGRKFKYDLMVKEPGNPELIKVDPEIDNDPPVDP